LFDVAVNMQGVEERILKKKIVVSIYLGSPIHPLLLLFSAIQQFPVSSMKIDLQTRSYT